MSTHFWNTVVIIFSWLGIVLALNYGLALAGEPRAVWFMHDVLGLM